MDGEGDVQHRGLGMLVAENDFCPSFFSVVIKHSHQKQLMEGEGVFQLIGYSPTLREGRAGTWSRNYGEMQTNEPTKNPHAYIYVFMLNKNILKLWNSNSCVYFGTFLLKAESYIALLPKKWCLPQWAEQLIVRKTHRKIYFGQSLSWGSLLRWF